MPQVNLLPPEIRARQRERRMLITFMAVGGVVLVFLMIIWAVQRARIGAEEEELQALEVERSGLQAEVAALQQFGDLQTSVEQTRQTLATALAGDVAWSKLLNDLSLIMPDNSWLVNLALTAQAGQAPTGEAAFGTSTFQGFVFDFPGLAGWLTRMTQIDGLTFVYLTSGTRQDLFDSDVVSFGANASITEILLSQRCQEGQPCP